MRMRVEKVFTLLVGVSLLVAVEMMMVLSVVMLAVLMVVLVLICDRSRSDSFQFSPQFPRGCKNCHWK